MSDLFLGQPEHSGAPAADTRSSRRATDRRLRRRRRHRRGGIALALTVLLLVGAGYVGWSYVVPMFSGSQRAVADYPGPGQGEVKVIIKAGDTGATIGSTLAADGVVASTAAFTRAALDNPQAPSIQPGTYTLQRAMSGVGAVAALLDPARRVQLKVTIAEGLRVTQILEQITGVTGIAISDLQHAAADPKALGVPAAAGGNLEGWLFPATYEYEPGTDPVDILASMVTKTIAVLDERQVAPADRETVLIKASLVEKEGKLDVDRGKVARVIVNRLDRGMTLGMDSTLAFGLNKSGLALTASDLESDSAYNTRKRIGLPPGPIASPGLPSIDAVLKPTPGPWLFFVTVNPDTGETRFTDKYSEHLQNQALYQQWLAKHG